MSRAGSAPRMRGSHGHGHGATQPRPHHQQQAQPSQQQARPQRPHSSSVLSPRSASFASWSSSPSPSPSHSYSQSQAPSPSWHSSTAAAAAEAAAIFASSEALSPRRAAARCRSAGFVHPSGTAPLRLLGVADCLTPRSAAAAALAPPDTLAAALSSTGAPFYARLPPELWGEVLAFLDVSAVLASLARLDRTGARLALEPDAWVRVDFAGMAAALAVAVGPNSGGGGSGGGGGGGVNHSDDAALSLRASLHHTSTTARLMSLAPRWWRLRALDLSGLTPLVCDAFLARLVSAAGAGVRAQWALGLERLSLARCVAVTDAGMEALASCCGALRALDLSWAGLVTLRGLGALLDRCGPTLARLVLNRCHAMGDGAMHLLARKAPRLRDLDLTFCGSLTDAGVAALTAADSVCFRPRAAAAVASGDSDAEEGGGAEGAEGEGAQAHPGLQRLCLRWCRQITDESIRLICAPYPHPSPSANPAGSAAQTDSEWPSDATGEDGIERANVVSPVAFGEEERSCALVHLNVDHCSLLTDASLQHLSKSARSLRSLSAVYCPRLTPASLRYLASGATTQLRSLVLDHCDNFRAYFAASNSAVLRGLLLPAVPAAAASASASAAGRRVHPLAQLRLLSWRTCGHAGLERSRHAEIEAECCNGLAGPSPASGGAGDDDARESGSDGNNVLEWIRAAPSGTSSTPRSSPPPSARSRSISSAAARALAVRP